MEILGSGGRIDSRIWGQGQDIPFCSGSKRNKCAVQGISYKQNCKVLVRAQASGSDEPKQVH